MEIISEIHKLLSFLFWVVALTLLLVSATMFFFNLHDSWRLKKVRRKRRAKNLQILRRIFIRRRVDGFIWETRQTHNR